jgi:hypothetical protein
LRLRKLGRKRGRALAIPGELLADPEPTQWSTKRGAMGRQRRGEQGEVLVPSVYLEETTAQSPEPILELSGDALTESASLKRR